MLVCHREQRTPVRLGRQEGKEGRPSLILLPYGYPSRPDAGYAGEY
jgi:hypothetical protein